MSRIHSCEWSPPIFHPERFLLWSSDVRQLLTYLPYYVNAGRKERVFMVPSKMFLGRKIKITLDLVEEYANDQKIGVLILPDQQKEYEQLVQQNEHHKQWILVGEPRAEGPVPLWGPDGHGKPVLTNTEVTFSFGDNYGTHFFSLALETLLRGPDGGQLNFCFWYQGWSSDFIMQAVLIRLAYHFPEITISSDSGPAEWWEARLLCQKLFEVAELPPDLFVQYHRNLPTREAEELLRRVADGLPNPLFIARSYDEE